MKIVVVLSLGIEVHMLFCERALAGLSGERFGFGCGTIRFRQLAWRPDGAHSIRRDMVLAFMRIVLVLSLGIDVRLLFVYMPLIV